MFMHSKCPFHVHFDFFFNQLLEDKNKEKEITATYLQVNL